ncbi:hypothetical protein VTN96DRAFT_6764 [Rasamsonia emersonii]
MATVATTMAARHRRGRWEKGEGFKEYTVQNSVDRSRELPETPSTCIWPLGPSTLASAGARPNHGRPAKGVRDGTLELGRWLLRQSRLDCAPVRMKTTLQRCTMMAESRRRVSGIGVRRILFTISTLRNAQPLDCPVDCE